MNYPSSLKYHHRDLIAVEASLVFNGVDQYVEIANSDIVANGVATNFEDEFSIEVVVKFDPSSSFYILDACDRVVLANQWNGFIFYFSTTGGGSLVAYFYSGARTNISNHNVHYINASNLQADSWYHIIMTFPNGQKNTDDSIKGYVNGVKRPFGSRSGSTHTNAPATTQQYEIARIRSHLGSAFYSEGEIALVRYYSKELTAKEVWNQSREPFLVREDLAEYTIDLFKAERSAIVYNDEPVLNINTSTSNIQIDTGITVISDITPNRYNANQNTAAEQPANNSGIDFDGTDDVLYLNDNLNEIFSGIVTASIYMEVNLDAIPASNQNLFGAYMDGLLGDNRTWVFFTNTGKLRFLMNSDVRTSPNELLGLESSLSVAASTTSKILVTIDTNNSGNAICEFYIDGVQATTSTYITNGVFDGNITESIYPIYIGATSREGNSANSVAHTDGRLDDITVYNRVLTPAEAIAKTS